MDLVYGRSAVAFDDSLGSRDDYDTYTNARSSTMDKYDRDMLAPGIVDLILNVRRGLDGGEDSELERRASGTLNFVDRNNQPIDYLSDAQFDFSKARFYKIKVMLANAMKLTTSTSEIVLSVGNGEPVDDRTTLEKAGLQPGSTVTVSFTPVTTTLPIGPVSPGMTAEEAEQFMASDTESDAGSVSGSGSGTAAQSSASALPTAINRSSKHSTTRLGRGPWPKKTPVKVTPVEKSGKRPAKASSKLTKKKSAAGKASAKSRGAKKSAAGAAKGGKKGLAKGKTGGGAAKKGGAVKKRGGKK